MSLLSPTTCGFIKVFLYELESSEKTLLSTKDKGKVNMEALNLWNQHFVIEQFPIQKNRLVCYLQKIKGQMKNLRKRYASNVKELMKIFALKEWLQLTEDERSHHSLFKCKGCINNNKLKDAMGLFFITPNFKKEAAEHSIIFKHFAETNENVEQETTMIPEVVARVSEIVPPNLLKKYNKHVVKKTVESIKEATNEKITVQEMGSGISKNKFNEIRLIQPFESKENALKRSIETSNKIAAGLKRAPNPVGNTDHFNQTISIK